jgi:hypothetical protein
MDEDGIRDLVGAVARHGEHLPQRTTGSDIRNRAATPGGANRGSGRPEPAWWRRNLGRTVATVALILVASPVVAALVYVAIPASNHTAARVPQKTTTTVPNTKFTTTTTNATPDGNQSAARAIVGRAVSADDQASNFDLSFDLNGDNGMGSGIGVTGAGTVDLSPSIAMTLDNVEGATLWFGPNNAWESLGSMTEYTLSGFSEYAENVTGRNAGALGTFGFCSPTGLFDLSQNEIGPTTEIGATTVDGVATTEYAVTVNPESFLTAPGITSGEEEAIEGAIGVIGAGSITDDVYIDSAGNVVQTVSSADGATLTVSLSNFGSAGTVTLPPPESSIRSTVPTDAPIQCSTPVGVTTTTLSECTDATVPTTASTYTQCSSGQTGSSTTTTTGMSTETTPTTSPSDCEGAAGGSK